MGYRFYGWETATVGAAHQVYAEVSTPQSLYDALDNVWCPETCAARLREQWSTHNKTVGQCSITAFLAQDIFGGDVYGITLPDGAVHCYNVVGDCVFDLTSEQFGDTVLDYSTGVPQDRAEHWKDADKYSRYCLLCERLRAYCEGENAELSSPEADTQPLVTEVPDGDRPLATVVSALGKNAHQELSKNSGKGAIVLLALGAVFLIGSIVGYVLLRLLVWYLLGAVGLIVCVLGGAMVLHHVLALGKLEKNKVDLRVDFLGDHMKVSATQNGEQVAEGQYQYSDLILCKESAHYYYLFVAKTQALPLPKGEQDDLVEKILLDYNIKRTKVK